MDVLLHKYGGHDRVRVPSGLQELLHDISKEVLRQQPSQLCSFIADYLDSLVNVRTASAVMQDFMSAFFEELGSRAWSAGPDAEVASYSLMGQSDSDACPGQNTSSANLLPLSIDKLWLCPEEPASNRVENASDTIEEGTVRSWDALIGAQEPCDTHRDAEEEADLVAGNTITALEEEGEEEEQPWGEDSDVNLLAVLDPLSLLSSDHFLIEEQVRIGSRSLFESFSLEKWLTSSGISSVRFPSEDGLSEQTIPDKETAGHFSTVVTIPTESGNFQTQLRVDPAEAGRFPFEKFRVDVCSPASTGDELLPVQKAPNSSPAIASEDSDCDSYFVNNV